MENTFFQDYQNLINSFEALKKEASNPFFKSKYVTLNQILPIVKKHCTEHNFVFTQTIGRKDNVNILETALIHKSDKSITSQIEIIAKDQSDPQKVGAGITYARRYSLVTMFCLEDEDDDGNTASQPQGQKNATQATYSSFTPKNDNIPVEPEYMPISKMSNSKVINKMSNYKKPENTLVVGDKCPVCGETIIAGKFGAYCVACWKKKNNK